MNQMTAGPPIIAYAGAPDRAAAAAVDTPDENRVFTFAAPPVGSQVIFSVAVFVACAVGALIVVALCLDACLERRRDYGYTLFWSKFALAFMAGVVAYTCRDLKRVRKYNHDNVRFEIRGNQLLAWVPQQWGPEPRAIELEEIRRDIRAGVAADVSRVRIFEIHVHRHSWLTTYWSIRVAVADHGVMKRAMADLNAAVARARARAIIDDQTGGRA
jgi:hypothetical protein